MFVLLVGLAQPALATGPSYQAFPGVCDPYQPSNYEMVDYNGHRTIWGRKLFCNGNALFSALPGQNTLHLTDVMHPGAPHIPNPGSTGSFTGTFELVDDGCGPHETPNVTVHEGSHWHVSYQVAAPEPNTDHKGTRNVEDEYQLGLVRLGMMTSGNLSVHFDNKPGDNSKGHQIGFGANDKETHDFGGAFWFYWDLKEGGHPVKSGHGDFNFDLQCITPPSGCPTDGGLGLDGFGVYVCDDFTAQNSDSQGAMAIGGDATFFNYGVASQSDNGNGVGLTVGGNLDAFNAQVYNGLAEAGTCDRGPHNPTTDNTPSFNVLNGSLTCGVNNAGPDCSSKCEVADYLSSLNDTNCHVTIQPWGQIDINVTGDDAVCTLDTDAAVNTFQWVWNNWINGISVNGNHPDTVIINIKGSQDIWGKNGQMWLNGVDPDSVVWNLGCNNGVCDSTGHNDFLIQNVGVKGSFLAPDCNVDFINGHIDGQYFVYSHHGTGEFHDFDFGGDICPPQCIFTADVSVDDLHNGEIVTNQLPGVTVSAVNNGGGPDIAVVFDSENPMGGDPDLGTPNSDFGGPGIGTGGASGAAGENNTALGNVIIIAENATDSDGDGNVDVPDDEAGGGVLTYTFSTPREIVGLDVLDIENNNSEIRTYSMGGALLNTYALANLGDNSYQFVAINETGVGSVEIDLKGSGAVNIVEVCVP